MGEFSALQRESVVDFVIGNSLFVMLHEIAHNVITEFKIPVLGRQEDAADQFAVITLLKIASPMSDRVLVQAARGWFLSDQRAKKAGDAPLYYDEHGLDQQRAYQIVCLMVGSDPIKFAGLADDAKLPEERRKSCQNDYADASSGWDAALMAHRRGADQPETKIDVAYGAGTGELDLYAQGFRAVELLEAMRGYLTTQFALPASFALETQSCGFINAAWLPAERKLVFCYELAADFAELYRVKGVKLREVIQTMRIDDQPGYVPGPEVERLPASYQRGLVYYRSTAAPGTIIVNPTERTLYLLQGKNRALRYKIGVGQDCIQWSGQLQVTAKTEWPDWSPTPAMLARQPDLPKMVRGGPGNPLGARALNLGNAVCRINGTNQPQTIGQAVRSGCFRMLDSDVIDLYDRVPVGTKVIIRQAPDT
jgi:lipoprotein-anchoring transpeptidase ErfK/SrfK